MNNKIEVLKDFKIIKQSNIPLYFQAYLYLLKKINSSEFIKGDKLPNEYKLCEILKISRITVRQALNKLEEIGIVLRIRGSGTYVIGSSQKTHDLEISTFVEILKKAKKELGDKNNYPIVNYMLPQVKHIKSTVWKPVLRPAKRKFNIAYGTLSQGVMWYHDLVVKSIIDSIRSMGCEVMILDNSLDKQKAIENTKIVIDKFKKNEIDFFINAQVFSKLNKDISKMLEEAKVPACGVDVYLDNFPFFHVDDYRSGFSAGEWLGSYGIKNNYDLNKTKFLYIKQTVTGNTAELREKGAIDGFNLFIQLEDNNYHLLETDIGVEENVKELVKQWLGDHPDYHNILISGSQLSSTLGALQALRESRRESDAVICGFSGAKRELLELVNKNSPYKGTVCTFPQKYGNIVIPYAVDYLEGNIIPADLVGYAEVITVDNLDRFFPEFLLK